jgi:glycosyltransferase involved in cell wall biosynthesis
MKINKKIIIFTYDYPIGDSENTFIKFELFNLTNNFKKIEIIPQKNLIDNYKKNLKNKFNVNLGLSKKLNIFNLIINFFTYTLFSVTFYKELTKIIFKKNFYSKLKISTIELTKSEIAYNWIKKNKLHLVENVIFYSFWSNFLLLAFERLKKDNLNIKIISRTLGSDLNGFIKNDDYVPFIDKKFYALSKVFVLADFQKKILLKKKLIAKNKIIINPLGTYKIQSMIKKKVINQINFLSCNNLIKIKNNFKMIEFIKDFTNFSKKKVNYYVIGTGYQKKKIMIELKKYKKQFNYITLNKINNLPKFMINNNIHFFLNFSSQEGMSFSIMEAMSCNIPVISSKIKANQNLVNDNNGYLVDLKKSFIPVSKIINNDLNNEKKYFLKCKKAGIFIKKNLINKNCNKKFLVELKKI